MTTRAFLSIVLLATGSFACAQSTYNAKFEEYVGLKYPCGGEVVPVVKIRNEGSAAMSGCVVDTWKNGLMVNSFDWQLAVPALQGEARTPALPAVPIEPGDELEFRIISVNTVPDEVAEGNIITTALDEVPASSANTTVTVEVGTDSDPGDLTWEIRNSMNVVVASGGPYAEENAVVVTDVPLGENACFMFKANDAGRGGGSTARFSVKANGNTLISAEGDALVGGFSKGLTTAVDVVCTEQLEVELETDAFPAETSWEVIDQVTGSVVCAGGGGYPSEGTVLETCCLPEGCYRLRVMDASGNGITDGGYVLRTDNGDRIIDDKNNFLSGGISAIAGEQGFCLPLGPTRPLYTSCDKYFWKKGEFIVINEDPDVAAEWIANGSNAVQSSTTGYDFWFYDPNGTYSFIRQRRHNVSDGFGNVGSPRTCHMQVNNWAAANWIPDQVPLNVRVRAVVNNVPKNWGPACRFMRDDALALCPPTKLMDVPGNPFISCNVFRDFNDQSINRLYARPIAGATKYRFSFSNSEGTIVREVSTYYLPLGWSAGCAAPLSPGSTYDVQVEAFKGEWCVAGEACTVTINNAVNDGQQNSALNAMTDIALNVYPNPNLGDQLHISLSTIDEGVNAVDLDIFDPSGKCVSRRTIPAQGGFVDATVDLNGELGLGIYLVTITAGGARHTERLIVQP